MRPHPLIIIATFVVACGAGTATTTTAVNASTTTTTTTTTISESGTTVAEITTTTSVEVPEVTIQDGEVEGPGRITHARGETVVVILQSDQPYEVHIHGYDLYYDLEPGTPLTIEFTADVPGIFAVETHPGHLEVFELEVTA